MVYIYIYIFLIGTNYKSLSSLIILSEMDNCLVNYLLKDRWSFPLMFTDSPSKLRD